VHTACHDLAATLDSLIAVALVQLNLVLDQAGQLFASCLMPQDHVIAWCDKSFQKRVHICMQQRQCQSEAALNAANAPTLVQLTSRSGRPAVCKLPQARGPADVRHDKVLQDCDNSCKQRGYLTLGHPGLLAQRCMKGIASHSTVQSCTSCQYYSGPQTHSTSLVWLLQDVSHIGMH